VAMLCELIAMGAALVLVAVMLVGALRHGRHPDNKQWILVGVSVLVLAVIVVPALPCAQSYRLHRLAEVDPAHIVKMTIRDGSTGELRSTVDADVIGAVLDDLRDVELRVGTLRMGYAYAVEAHGEGFHVSVVVRGAESSAVTIGRANFLALFHRTYVTSRGFDPAIIRDVYNSLPPTS